MGDLPYYRSLSESALLDEVDLKQHTYYPHLFSTWMMYQFLVNIIVFCTNNTYNMTFM